MAVRVELSDPIQATFNAAGASVTGKLFDMSLTGVSIAVTADPGLPLSEKGELSVTLPNEVITVPASLLTIKPGSDGCRLIFEMEATRAAELCISQYIFRRQVEIIKELRDHPGITQ